MIKLEKNKKIFKKRKNSMNNIKYSENTNKQENNVGGNSTLFLPYNNVRGA